MCTWCIDRILTFLSHDTIWLVLSNDRVMHQSHGLYCFADLFNLIVNIKWVMWPTLAHSLIRLLIRSFTGWLVTALSPSILTDVRVYAHTHLHIIPVRLSCVIVIDSHRYLDRHNKNGNFALYTCIVQTSLHSPYHTHALTACIYIVEYFETCYRFFHSAHIGIFERLAVMVVESM